MPPTSWASKDSSSQGIIGRVMSRFICIFSCGSHKHRGPLLQQGSLESYSPCQTLGGATEKSSLAVLSPALIDEHLAVPSPLREDEEFRDEEVERYRNLRCW